MIIVRFAKIYPHKETAAPNGAAVNRFSVVTPRLLTTHGSDASLLSRLAPSATRL
jgi:hypothetical protein